ncbi:DUF452 family protein [Marinifilum sp.]|uniref:DUF452 family protein n=1 Tax=Marinifilum sp. TaxID=2033137 RepID=UPI003BAA0587
MKTKWIHKNSKKECILFFNGWSFDDSPFSHLPSDEYDVMMCYDYRDILLPKEIEQLFADYNSINLIAWSLGVYIANLLLKDLKGAFANIIAINGTTYPIDNLKGIPPNVFQGTVLSLDEKNLEKFWMRMCGGKSAYQHFKANLPKRDLSDQYAELVELQSIIQTHFVDWSIFCSALIGKQDLIFTLSNQKYAWNSNVECIERDYPHYCFDKWNSWDEIIEDLSCGKPRN